MDQLPTLEKIILIEGQGDGDRVMSWAELDALGAQALAGDADLVHAHRGVHQARNAGDLDLHLRDHWIAEGCHASAEQLGVPRCEYVRPRRGATRRRALPMAAPSHSFGKVLLSAGYQVGFVTYVDGRVPKIVENLPSIQPTIMAGVPRIFEKIYQGANAKAKEGGGAKGQDLRLGVQSVDRHQGQAAGRPVRRAHRRCSNGPGRQIGLLKIRALTGGRMKVMISGSAALNGDVARWFDAAGLPIIEGYGLTENSGAACVVHPTTSCSARWATCRAPR